MTRNLFDPFGVIPEMPEALSGIFANAAGSPRISASAFGGDKSHEWVEQIWCGAQ
jgi:hypothetical protein